jgi:hypothetical protein
LRKQDNCAEDKKNGTARSRRALAGGGFCRAVLRAGAESGRGGSMSVTLPLDSDARIAQIYKSPDFALGYRLRRKKRFETPGLQLRSEEIADPEEVSSFEQLAAEALSGVLRQKSEKFR